MSQPLDSKARRSGQAIILATVSLFFLFAVMGLAVDLGWGYFKKMQVHAAAEAAAVAAAVYAHGATLSCGSGSLVCNTTYTCASPPTSPPTSALQAGCLYAKNNGFVQGGNGGRQAVSLIANTTAPPGVTGNSPNFWVQANVSETIPGMFLFLKGLQSASVASQAIAAVTVIPASSCIFALDGGNTSGAFSASGSLTVTSNCGIYVNSSSTSGFDVTGSGNINATQILVHGSNYHKTGSGSVTPTPTVNSPTIADPFAGLSSPAVPACATPTVTTTGSESWSYNSTNGVSISGSGSATLTPGIYCGGIHITGSGSITFNSGIYIVNGGGFTASGSGTFTGANVMFYNTGRNGQTAAAVGVSGSMAINFSAPNGGDYEGILLYQDRSVTYAATNTFTGSTTSNMTGTLYFPSTKLSYSGSSSGHYQALVAKTISMTGSANFLNDTTGTYTGLASDTTSVIY